MLRVRMFGKGLAIAVCAVALGCGGSSGSGSSSGTDSGAQTQDSVVLSGDTTSPPNDSSVPPASDTGGTNPPSDTSTPPDTNVPPPQDTGSINPPGNGKDVGAPCASGTECKGGSCLTQLEGGYCTQKNCASNPCPAGSGCYEFTNGDTYCLKTCSKNADCSQNSGHICDTDGVCWPGTTTTPPNPGSGAVGDACESDSDCKDTNAQCYPYTLNGSVTGFVNGYCLINGCSSDSQCPTSSTCEPIYQGGNSACVASCAATSDCRSTEGYMCGTLQGGAGPLCWPGCGQDSTCPAGYGCEGGICMPACTATSCGSGKVCGPDGLCIDPPCTPTSCAAGLVCSASGVCVPDVSGGPGAGPGPTCNNLPTKDCTGSASYCSQILPFEPLAGPGYSNYPLNGECTTCPSGKNCNGNGQCASNGQFTDQWRSYARRDLIMLIKYATAYVDCKAKAWIGGNGYPLGLGDMSEANGAIPGASVGSPGHPPGTHVNGNDMDIAYYQNAGQNNYLKSICNSKLNGAEQYHCVGEPYLLDLWKTSIFIGALLTSNMTRVIGVDGKVGPLVEQALTVLCANNWVSKTACQKMQSKIAYEVTNGGAGWYQFHHHHLHVSLYTLGASKPGAPVSGKQCLIEGCPDMGSVTGDGVHPEGCFVEPPVLQMKQQTATPL